MLNKHKILYNETYEFHMLKKTESKIYHKGVNCLDINSILSRHTLRLLNTNLIIFKYS